MDAGSLLLLAIPLLLLFMITSQSRRRKREVADVQSALAPGARVMTTSGMYATVTAIEGDEVTLEAAPGQTSQWNRQAVGRVVIPAEPAPDADAGAESTGMSGLEPSPGDEQPPAGQKPSAG